MQLKPTPNNPSHSIGDPHTTSADSEERAWKRRYDLIAAAAGQVTYEYNSRTGSVLWGDSLPAVLGYELSEMQGGVTQWEDLIHPEDRVQTVSLLEESDCCRTSFDVTYRFRHKDGHYIWINDRGLRAEDTTLVGVLIDITARRRMEQELADKEALWRSMFNVAPYSISISRLSDATYVETNPAFTKMSGFTPEETIGKTSMIHGSLGHKGQLQRSLERLLQDGVIHNEELVAYTKDGKKQNVSYSAAIFQLNSENYVVSIAEDITERKKAQEALLESERHLADIIDFIPDATMVIDSQGRITAWNRAMELMTGVSAREMIGKGDYEYSLPFYGERRPVLIDFALLPQEEIEAKYSRLKRMGALVIAETVVRFTGPEPRCLSCWAHPIYNAAGELAGSIECIRDITEIKKAEEEKSTLQAQLVQAMKMEAIGRLAGGVAHDFNNMLTAISGNVELAKMNLAASDPLNQYLSEIDKAAQSAASLTRQLLAFSRQQIIEPKVVCLNELIGYMRNMIARLIGEDIDLRLILAQDLGSVRVDPNQFEQVLVNLAVNARDAMPGGGRLLLETCNKDLDEDYCSLHPQIQPGPFIQLAISDTGHGMSPEVKERIFEPFYTTKPKGKGTGLGLATTFGVIKQAGGTIEVYSEIGVGTSFKILLPRIEKPAERLVREDLQGNLNTGTETIMLVEDEEALRHLISTMLIRLGYHVQVASSGAEALGLAQEVKDPIDLLMTDVVMPGINGRDLAIKMQTIFPKIKILFTSGYTENIIVHHGILEESLNFIGKPFSMQSLAKKIRETLQSEQSLA